MLSVVTAMGKELLMKCVIRLYRLTGGKLYVKLQVGITRKYGKLTGDVTTVDEHMRDK